MKTHILIGGARIVLPSKLPRIAENTPPSKRGILYQLKYQPDLVEENAIGFYELIQNCQVPPPRNIVELFAGAGINSQILQFMFSPSTHTVYPNDRWCYSNLFQIGRRFNWHTSILEPLGGAGDVVAEEIEERGADLLVADFPNWTMAKSRKQYYRITQAVFSKATWVVLTDSTRVQAPELDACVAGMGYRTVAGVRGKSKGGAHYLLFKKA